MSAQLVVDNLVANFMRQHHVSIVFLFKKNLTLEMQGQDANERFNITNLV
jgi:hypothetical protein